MRIGLALSGGGMRAAVFHLGILTYLAEEKLLSNVAHISTVSGASICMGLIYGSHNNKWPSNESFLKLVLPKIEQEITEKDIQWSSLWRLLIQPYYWDKKVNLLGNVMERKWIVHGCLQDIPDYPLWTINTTAYESGKDFRISSKWMGEMNRAHVMRPRMRLSHAMAASAGFPVLIGPYKVKTKNYTWYDQTETIVVKPRDRVVHLWDGGVYDNMGLDPLFTTSNDGMLHEDINYLIVSNASGNIEHKTRNRGFSIGNLKRMLDINMDQVETLKTIGVIDLFKNYHNGVYLKIGSEVKDILAMSKLPEEDKKRIIDASMKTREVSYVKNYKTSLEKMSKSDFHKIMQHGYEIAASTLNCWGHIG